MTHFTCTCLYQVCHFVRQNECKGINSLNGKLYMHYCVEVQFVLCKGYTSTYVVISTLIHDLITTDRCQSEKKVKCRSVTMFNTMDESVKLVYTVHALWCSKKVHFVVCYNYIFSVWTICQNLSHYGPWNDYRNIHVQNLNHTLQKLLPRSILWKKTWRQNMKNA